MDYSSKAQDLLEKNKVNMGTISAIMDSREGKALLKQISGGGGDALKKAAAEAAEGDSDAAGRLIKSLLSTKEGQALAGQVMKMSKK